ncbi:MAG: BON domain-containing protein [Pseudomonadota bacterium]|nr:BON domain-containing protein [Pseudomonadota bacterium]MDQ8017179.1 BON domain-containing protein [Pseudomonadota bacterium]
MKSDTQIRDDVLAELRWDPAVNPTDVGVIVKDGNVTLTGHLSSFAQKYAAERAVQRVIGVRGVAVELDVRLPSSHRRTDAEIAAAVERAIEWHTLIPTEKVHPKVEKGWVTLTGEAEWDYQRRAAEGAVRHLLGVTGVTNLITVKPRVKADIVEGRIREALERQADREAKKIEVGVAGTAVTLRGKVHSLAERHAAQGAAWSAPGVTRVINDILVEA